VSGWNHAIDDRLGHSFASPLCKIGGYALLREIAFGVHRNSPGRLRPSSPGRATRNDAIESAFPDPSQLGGHHAARSPVYRIGTQAHITFANIVRAVHTVPWPISLLTSALTQQDAITRLLPARLAGAEQHQHLDLRRAQTPLSSRSWRIIQAAFVCAIRANTSRSPATRPANNHARLRRFESSTLLRRCLGVWLSGSPPPGISPSTLASRSAHFCGLTSGPQILADSSFTWESGAAHACSTPLSCVAKRIGPGSPPLGCPSFAPQAPRRRNGPARRPSRAVQAAPTGHGATHGRRPPA